MNRVLQWFNFVGVLALTGLCVVQWKVNRQLNLAAAQLERLHLADEAKTARDSKTISEQASDLEEFRERVRLCEVALADSEKQLQTAQSERDRLNASVDQLKASLAQWTAAVAQRDAAIKQAAAQIQKLADDRNEAVRRFNDLAEKYNALAKK